MKRFILIIVIAISGSSCLKNNVDLDYSNIQPTVVVADSNWPNGDPYSPIQDSALGVTVLHLKARLSYAVPITTPIKVSFKKDAQVLNEYNTKWSGYGVNYADLPDDCYQLPGLEVTIPANTKEVDIPITLFPDKIQGTQDYLIAYTITTAGDQIVAANAKTMVFTLKAQ